MEVICLNLFLLIITNGLYSRTMTKKFDRCPVCNSTASTEEVAVLNGSSQERYLSYSNLKYDGLLNEWLNVLNPAIDRCKLCGHHWYREQPSDDMLFSMYSQGDRSKELLKQTGLAVQKWLRKCKNLSFW